MASLSFNFECPPEDSQCLQDCVEDCCNTCKCDCCSCGAPNLAYVQFTGIAERTAGSFTEPWDPDGDPPTYGTPDGETDPTPCGSCTDLNGVWWPCIMNADYCYWTNDTINPCAESTGFEINCDVGPQYTDACDNASPFYRYNMQTGVYESSFLMIDFDRVAGELPLVGDDPIPLDCLGKCWLLDCLSPTPAYWRRTCEYLSATVTACTYLPPGGVVGSMIPLQASAAGLRRRLLRPDVIHPYAKRNGTIGFHREIRTMGGGKLAKIRNNLLLPKKGVELPRRGRRNRPCSDCGSAPNATNIKKRKSML